MTDQVTFDWNGETIDFSAWADDAYGSYDYTTRNRRYTFEFNLVPHYGVVRIFIVAQPSYGSRRADGHSTHRYGLQNGKPYICVRSDLEPCTVPDALSWAIYWAEQTSDYIDNGKTFS